MCICFRYVKIVTFDFWFKACVFYLLTNLSFSPNDSHLTTQKMLWKMFLFNLKSSFRSWDIQLFVFPSSPLSLPVSHSYRAWSKINFKVYDVSNCLNKNLTHFVWYLEKKKRYDIEILSTDRLLNKEHFYRKIMQKMCTKS